MNWRRVPVEWQTYAGVLEIMLKAHYLFIQPRVSVDGMSSQDHSDQDLATLEAKPKIKKPPLYKVILLNDDFTPMDFVVDVLQRFFRMDQEKATQIMLHVHTRGKGVCGVFTRDVAETKVQQVNSYSREHQHPLLCALEEA